MKSINFIALQTWSLEALCTMQAATARPPSLQAPAARPAVISCSTVGSDVSSDGLIQEEHPVKEDPAGDGAWPRGMAVETLTTLLHYDRHHAGHDMS